MLAINIFTLKKRTFVKNQPGREFVPGWQIPIIHSGFFNFLTLTFSDIKLSAPLLRALEISGYSSPTPIQQQAIPYILQGKDLLGCAQTGTGKTAAFSLPILQGMYEARQNNTPTKRNIEALILSPTRELAIQIGESLSEYGKFTDIKHTVIFGGVPVNPQIQTLRKGVSILVATPGRLLDLMNQGEVSLKSVRYFVLDEADRMLDMGFIRDIRKIVSSIPEKRQTLLFSATMPPDIAALAQSILRNPERVDATPVSSAAPKIVQAVYPVAKPDKPKLLVHLINGISAPGILVFTRTKHGADKVVKVLSRANIKAAAIHGNKSQNARQNALNGFKAGKINVLVATDIAARGIDVDDLQYVINYDLPNEPETYVHRIGRTGRAGASGHAWSFCDVEERPYLQQINKLTSQQIPLISEHPYPLLQTDSTPAESVMSPPANSPKKRNKNQRNFRRRPRAISA